MTSPPSRRADAGRAERLAAGSGGRSAADAQRLERELQAGRRCEEGNRPGEALAHYRAALAMAPGYPPSFVESDRC
jgi:hypothetical protein